MCDPDEPSRVGWEEWQTAVDLWGEAERELADLAGDPGGAGDQRFLRRRDKAQQSKDWLRAWSLFQKREPRQNTTEDNWLTSKEWCEEPGFLILCRWLGMGHRCAGGLVAGGAGDHTHPVEKDTGETQGDRQEILPNPDSNK